MAYILNKSADTKSALSRASFDRQRDVYQLAEMGEKSSRRLWDEFASESPSQARVVIADVNADRARDVEANRHLDRVLVKSEKKAKKAKNLNALKAGASYAEVTEHEKYLRSLLNSPDPAIREGAKSALGLA